MTKHLYHIILFNIGTEKIDFKGYVSAKDEETALLTSVQAFGKYDANVHVNTVKYIMSYEKE